MAGEESVYFRKKHSSGKSSHWRDHFGKSMFWRKELSISHWPDGQPRPGRYQYPFTFTLPENLLPSLLIMEPSDSRARSSVVYHMIVQFVPLNGLQLSKTHRALSPFRGELCFYVYCPREPVMQKARQGTLTLSVGGFIGIRSRECKCKVTVLSTECNIGQPIMV